jgi:hypothetical protein
VKKPRKRGWWPAAAGGAFCGIAVTLLLTGFGGGGSSSDAEDRWHVMCDPDPGNPCPGTTDGLVETCSCEPSGIAYRNSMCFLDEHMRQEVSQCFRGGLQLSTLDSATTSCVETKVQNDPEAKALFLQATEKANDLAATLTPSWNDCYRCWSKGQQKGCEGGASP